MMKRTILSAVAASILATSSAFAQVSPDTNAPPPPPPGGNFRQAGRMQHRLAEMHDRLGITPAQQPQWDALVATLRQAAAAMRGNPAAQAIRSGHLDAVQEFRAAADLARQRADVMQQTLPAVEALYSVLSPEQRQVADREVSGLIHRGPGRG